MDINLELAKIRRPDLSYPKGCTVPAYTDDMNLFVKDIVPLLRERGLRVELYISIHGYDCRILTQSNSELKGFYTSKESLSVAFAQAAWKALTEKQNE